MSKLKRFMVCLTQEDLDWLAKKEEETGATLAAVIRITLKRAREAEALERNNGVYSLYK